MLKHAGVLGGTLALAVAGLLVLGAARFVEPGGIQDVPGDDLSESGEQRPAPSTNDNGSGEAARDGTADSDEPRAPLDLTMNRIDGTPQKLREYRGDVVIIVNVASRCGFTAQYDALQKLYEQRRGDGLTILGFPANDFGDQEPGTNEQIAEFCSTEFGVTFPMFEKIGVKGDDQHPLYKMLTERPEPLGGEIGWNFTKFILGRDGRVQARFGPRDRPDSERFLAEVDRLLAEPKPEDDSAHPG